MPMPLLKLLFLLVSLAVLLLVLLYVSLSVNFPLSASPSFFPTSAIISLAEDNSTFFLSKPAAFGPLLPKKGLTGELFVLPETELACDDAVPDGFWWRDDEDAFQGHEVESDADGVVEIQKNELPDDIQTLQDSGEMNGKIVLVQRGGCGFYDKVLWSQRRGAMAVIVGDNEAHRPLLTMYAKGDTSNISIPAIFTSYTTAHLLVSLLPKHNPKPNKEDFSNGPGYSPIPTDRPSRDYERLELEDSEGSAATSRNSLLSGSHAEDQNRAADESVEIESSRWLELSDDDSDGEPDGKKPDMSHGLWITLTPTRLSSSPFVDTLLVLVVSPLITLSVVYTMLLLRSRYRRRRWRAPKSIVDQLPVHTYQPPSDPPSPTAPQNIPSSPDARPPNNSEKSLPGSLVASSFPNTNQVSTSASSSSAFPPLSRVSSAPQPETSTAKDKPKMSRRRMAVLPGFKYFPPSPECVVCLEEYVVGESQVMRLPCGHEFHVNCITPWLTTRRRTCPVCKCDVVKALGGGNGYSSTASGDEENGPAGDVRPIGGVEGRGQRGLDIWWRAFMGAMGIEGVGRGNEIGERTPLIDGQDADARRQD